MKWHKLGVVWKPDGSLDWARTHAMGPIPYRLNDESRDGVQWVRQDEEMGLDVSPTGVDAEAIMYSAVLSVGVKTYCFYNGNNFGEQGFCVAELIP
ncbi:hypothetical protein [Pseudomonas sp. LB3P25]